MLVQPPTILLLLLAILHKTTAKDFIINITKLQGALCYQCVSYSREREKWCDDEVFMANKGARKFQLMFQCPAEMTYCLKSRTLNTPRGVLTERMCGTIYDAKNHTLKNGCIFGEQKIFCVCDTNLCNDGARAITQVGAGWRWWWWWWVVWSVFGVMSMYLLGG